MVRTIKIIFLILGSVILQASLVARVTMFGSRPDLPLALVVSMSLFGGPLYGELAGFATGLLCDLVSGGPLLGTRSFSMVVIGYSAGFVRGRLYSDNVITQSVSGFVSTIADRIITSIHLSLLFADTRFFHIRLPGLVLASIANSILVVLVFQILGKFVRIEQNI